jgi:hypothetical protein
MNDHVDIQIPVGMTKEAFKLNFKLLFLLAENFRTLKLQEERIQSGIKEGDRISVFADIHYYLIGLKNLSNLLLRIQQVFSGDKVIVDICKRARKDIRNGNFTEVRDAIEHYVEGSKDPAKDRLTTFADLGNLSGNIYSFGNHKIDLSTASICINHIAEEFGKNPTFVYYDELTNTALELRRREKGLKN